MENVIECAGDPRAMGNAQGLACRSAVQERIARIGGRVGRPMLPSLRALTSGSALGRGTGREIIRHYTHLSERMTGLARHADVSFDSLVRVFCESTGRDATPNEELLASSIAIGALEVEDGAGGSVVLRSLASVPGAGSQWIIRKSRPEVGFASAEVTLPWLATAVAGVNQAGLAVAIVPRAGACENGPYAGAVIPRGEPHASLLVQECLQRFEDVEGGLDWCSKRPSSGNASIVLCDASGQLATVEIVGTRCNVRESSSGFIADGAPPKLIERIAAHHRDKRSIDLTAIAGDDDSLGDQIVWLDPEGRSLTLRTTSGSAGVLAQVEVDF